MAQFNSIEEKLARLVPPALSDEGQRKLEDLIEDLSGANKTIVQTNTGIRLKASIGAAAAAVLLFSASIVLVRSTLHPETKTTFNPLNDKTDHGKTPEMIVLTSTKLMGGRENDGLIVPRDGTAPHYRYRYHMIDEEQVKDPGSGLVITLRQPRQEVYTIPITQF